MDLIGKNQKTNYKKINNCASVSVIIPCYNCQDTILRAVTSVVEQTWKPKELILINDASQDDTLEILKNLQMKFGKDWVIKIINLSENKGPSCARNAGWDIATQSYIAFLDADDAWHPNKIGIQLKYMMEHSEIVVTGHRFQWIRSGGRTIKPLPTHYTVKSISRLRILLSNRLSTISVMLKREIHFRFESTKRFSEDYLLWLSIILSGNKAAFIDLELAYIYKAPYGEGGLSSNLWNMEKGELDVFNRLRKSNKISMLEWLILNLYSLLKFLLRWIKCNIRFNTVM
jgi:glycosyltransferase involved in cell wall biosynthesis